MNHTNRLPLVPLVLILSVLACSLPTVTPAPPAAQVEGPALTITALAATIQAQQNQPSPLPPQVITATQVPTGLPPLPTETATLEPTPTLTLTPSVPVVIVSLDTNCRSGPGKDFNELGALLVGESAEVVGRNTPNNYWIIKNPDARGTCWLWGQYATVSGNLAAIPEVAAPVVPAAPGGLSISRVCKNFANPAPHVEITKVTFTWSDKSDNEDGFYIYRDGTIIATLGPGATSFSENPPGNKLNRTYGVAAFNEIGTSEIKERSVSCP